MMTTLHSFFAQYYTLILVSVGTLLVGATAAGVGVFAVLRRQSLLGDAISHAALPGLALMFMYSKSANPFILMLGGGIAGSIGAFLVLLIAKTTTLKHDALLGIILSVFFGFGVVLKTVIQKQGLANQAVLGKFFFGNASTLVPLDIAVIAGMAFLIFCALALWWKEFVLLSFDAEFSRANGYPVTALEFFLTILIVFSIVIGLHTVGVLLMSALLIAPAAAARQVSSSVAGMFFIAMVFGAVSGVCGSLVSSQFEHVPTGPTIVVCMSLIVVVTFLFSPKRNAARGEL
jgi:manganese/zinc/iron transport system permease protein